MAYRNLGNVIRETVVGVKNAPVAVSDELIESLGVESDDIEDLSEMATIDGIEAWVVTVSVVSNDQNNFIRSQMLTAGSSSGDAERKVQKLLKKQFPKSTVKIRGSVPAVRGVRGRDSATT